MVTLSPTGALWECLVLTTKYGFELNVESFQKNCQRLINQLWKLIPMREHEEDWTKQLDTVINEIAGLNEILNSRPQFLQLLSKLEGLQKEEYTFEFYRKTVFEAINIIQEFKHNENF